MGHKYKGRKKKKNKKKAIDVEKNRRFHQKRRAEMERLKALEQSKADRLYNHNADTTMAEILTPFFSGLVLIGLGFLFFHAVPYHHITLKPTRIEDVCFGLAMGLVSVVLIYAGFMLVTNKKHPLLPNFLWCVATILCFGLSLTLPVNALFVHEFNAPLAGLVGGLALPVAGVCAYTFERERQRQNQLREAGALALSK